MISADDYYGFGTNIKTCTLKLWQDKEGLVLNGIGITVHWKDKEFWQYMEDQNHS